MYPGLVREAHASEGLGSPFFFLSSFTVTSPLALVWGCVAGAELLELSFFLWAGRWDASVNSWLSIVEEDMSPGSPFS